MSGRARRFGEGIGRVRSARVGCGMLSQIRGGGPERAGKWRSYLSFFLLSGVPPGLGRAGRGGGEGGGRKFNFKRHHGSVAVAFGAFVPAAASETVRGGLGNVLSNTFS